MFSSTRTTIVSFHKLYIRFSAYCSGLFFKTERHKQTSKGQFSVLKPSGLATSPSLPSEPPEPRSLHPFCCPCWHRVWVQDPHVKKQTNKQKTWQQKCVSLSEGAAPKPPSPADTTNREQPPQWCPLLRIVLLWWLSCHLTFLEMGRFPCFHTNIQIHGRHYWCDRFFANSNMNSEEQRAYTCPEMKAMHSAFQSSLLEGYFWHQSANTVQHYRDWQHTTCSIKTSISCLKTQRAASPQKLNTLQFYKFDINTRA